VASTAAGLTSVVVVAADSGNDLTVCVASVLASAGDVEMIISDNASTDGSIESLAANFSSDAQLTILRNGTNLGFGTGCNRAAVKARGDTILFLNPDCRLDVDTIARLRAILYDDTTIGILGASIVDEAGNDEPASRRRDPLLRRALITMSGLSRFASRGAEFSGTNIVSNGATLEDVDAVSGALMMIARSTFDRIGGFDEGYFLHCEDLDICRRVRDAGCRVVCANDIRVVHGKGGSSRSRPVFVSRHKHRGMWRWFTKFDPAARNRFVRGIVWIGLWMHFVLMVPRHWFVRRR
jgi:N-acetylglucosaminyl-diphospho-decaprenol L-rhamnosyltransferase